MALLASACHSGRPSQDELVVLLESPPLNADPRLAVAAYDFKLSRLIYAPLVSVDDATVEPKMELAEEVVPLSNLKWRISLRDAKFSDGRSVTADDIVYSLDSSRQMSGRLRQRFSDDGLIKVEVMDARHLELTLSHPHAPFITDLDIGIIARPRSSDDKQAIGAGPFVIPQGGGREGETWHLDANPYFYGGVPKSKHLTIKTIRDDNSRLLALVGGSADLTQNTISPLLIDAVAEQPRLRVETDRSSVYTYLGLNCEDPILKDVRVRRAIALAIDRKQIISTKLHGRAVLATGMLPTFHWAYEPTVDNYDFDPARARQLLDEAGYPVRADGTRFTLVYKTSSNRFRVALASVIEHMLEAVGIGVDLRVNEFATFFADVKKGNFQMFTMQIPEIAEPDLYSHFFGSKRIPTREDLDAGGNRARYRNPELDKLFDQGRAEMDREKRKVIYSEVQKILAREVPVVSLWHEDNIAAMRREVQGYQILPTAQLTTLARTYKSP